MGGGLGGPGGFGAANPTTLPNPATNTTTPGTTPSTTDTTDTMGTPTGPPPPNPFMDPAMMQQLMGAFGGPGGGGMGGGGLFGAPATPADTRPPEERFQTQLQVSILWDGRSVDSRSVSLAAIERYGFLQRLAEHPCPPGDGRKRPCCHRVHSQRRRLVSLLFVNTRRTTSRTRVSPSLRTISCTSSLLPLCGPCV